MTEHDPVLAEQSAYYRARAPEYDEWWQRRGRYDHGEAANRRWAEEVRVLEAALDGFAPLGDVAELACGTGWWTARLVRHAATMTCVDAAPETLAINRARLLEQGQALPRYVEADLFAWHPEQRFDTIFFSFWLSHVPTERFEEFWDRVAAALKPDGRVLLIDSLPAETSGAIDHRPPDTDGIQERKLDDGRSFRVVKLYCDPADLTDRLGALGWHASLRRTETYFLYGEVRRA